MTLWRILAVATGLGTLVIVFQNISVAREHLDRSDKLSDLAITGLPLFFEVLALITSLAVAITWPANRTMQGAWRGLLMALLLVMGVVAWPLWNHSELLAADGTAYWGLLFLPCFWLGIPLAIGGVGLGIGLSQWSVRREQADGELP